MDNANYFAIATNSFALLWLGMVIAYLLPAANRAGRALLLIGGRLAPVALFIAFTVGVFNASAIEPAGSLTSFEGVVAKFSVPERLLNVWLEILAFILLVTHWIIGDARTRGLSKLAVTPCLVLSFVSAAWGLLGYLVVLGVVAVLSSRSNPAQTSRQASPTQA